MEGRIISVCLEAGTREYWLEGEENADRGCSHGYRTPITRGG